MFVGYARVSTQDQTPALQRDALTAAGCEKLFEETASGAQRDRPQLQFAFRARDGSQLALYDLDDFEELEGHYKFIFRRQDTNKRRTGFLKKSTLKKGGLRLDDFFDAPSFVVDLDKSSSAGLRVDFICARLGKIVKIKMSKDT